MPDKSDVSAFELYPVRVFAKEGKPTDTAIAIRCYLCSTCSNTHIQISIAGGTELVASVPPELAEEIAAQMINPPPVNFGR